MQREFLKIESNQAKDEQEVHYCAWCKGVFDKNGKLIRYMDSLDEAESHGVCIECKKNLLNGEHKLPIEDTGFIRTVNGIVNL